MRRKPSHSAFWVVYILGTVVVMLAADIEEIFDDWQQRMRVVQKEISQRLYTEDIRPCECTYHACISQPEAGMTRCLPSGHADSLNCSRDYCGYTKLSTDRAYVRVPPEVAFRFYSPNVKRDICLTEVHPTEVEIVCLTVGWIQGLAESFYRLRGKPKGFAPWTYFGSTETGVFVSWPGKPQEVVDNNRCRPYDPRLRPWWRYTAWQNRNVVIMLGASKTMELDIHGKNMKRWHLAISMTEKFLDTLSSKDTIQIMLFGNTPQPLLPEDGMMFATSQNLKRLRKELEKARPRQEEIIDIGKALNATFRLLESIKNPESRRCENHIILFTDRRDCTSSSEKDCAAKEAFNTQTAEFVSTGLADSIQFAANLYSESKGSIGRSTLFAYSLAPDASTLAGQLSCRLGGMHVDLERELREHGILDPLHLMRGYFMRAAVRVARSYDIDRMAISEIYEDDGGLGSLNTLVMPVYFKPHEKCPPIHYGNIGVDMPLAYYSANDIDWKSPNFNVFVDNWNFDLICSNEMVEVCDMQVLRGQEEQCVYPIEERNGQKCFEFQDHIYFVNYGMRIPAPLALSLCEEQGGELIAPKDLDERQFLATLAPPDGAWINLTQSGSSLIWPDGTEMEDAERRNVQRTCVDGWVDNAFYMDARNFKHNIQCSQALQGRPAICRYPIDDRPAVCTINSTRKVLPGSFNHTIQTCGMEECVWDALPTTNRSENELICNTKRKKNKSIDHALCCNDKDLDEVCANGEVDEKDDHGLVIGLGVATVIGLLLAVLCTYCVCRKAGLFGRKGHQQLLSSDALSPKNMEMIPNSLNNSIHSPFEVVTCGSPAMGKRPELVMNIEVKILDNGWEKVGGYGRVRQGEYTDGAGCVHRVAVKFVDALAPEAAWEALRNEFDILSSIPLHPNIVKPFGAHWGDRTEQATRYIVEELMYTNLGDLTKEESPFPVKTLVYKDWIKIFIGIANGLDHLHRYKIIHFDLKPRNVLLDEDLTAKIADFGCSKSKFDTYIELSKMAGTPPYLAPECWMLYYAQNCRTEVARIKIDVYSFGVIMWECLNGGSSLRSPLYRRPEASNSSSKSAVTPGRIEIRKDKQSSGSNSSWEIQYHLRDEIPVSLRDLVNACVRLDFDARPTTADILEILEQMLKADWINQPLPWTT